MKYHYTIFINYKLYCDQMHARLDKSVCQVGCAAIYASARPRVFASAVCTMLLQRGGALAPSYNVSGKPKAGKAIAN